MISVPRIPPAQPNQKLGLDYVNHIIKRVEYATDLLRQYKCVAGDDMFVEPHYDGTRISYEQNVGGGIKKNPLLPYRYPRGVIPPINPTEIGCNDSSGWSFSNYFNFDVCPNVGPPCGGDPVPSCANLSVSGYIVSNNIWDNSCLSGGKSAKCSFAATFDNYGRIGNYYCESSNICILSNCSGVTGAGIGSFNSKKFFIYIFYSANNSGHGGPYGFIGNGAFFLA